MAEWTCGRAAAETGGGGVTPKASPAHPPPCRGQESSSELLYGFPTVSRVPHFPTHLSPPGSYQPVRKSHVAAVRATDVAADGEGGTCFQLLQVPGKEGPQNNGG